MTPLFIDGSATRFARDGSADQHRRAVAVETPVQILYGGVPFAVMMATPGDLEDFALGFSLTEGVVTEAGEVRSVAVSVVADGFAVDIGVTPERMHATLARRRALSGRTGCGVCGIDDIAAVRRAGPGGPGGGAAPIRLVAIGRALDALPAHQVLGRRTGATHAAAWADREGGVVLVREDVGRHNALDKLIGAALRACVAPSGGFVVATSRCSFEMVEKTAVFGAPAIVCISGPTSFAIERAAALGVTLVAFGRGDSVSVFNGADRIVAGPDESFETGPVA